MMNLRCLLYLLPPALVLLCGCQAMLTSTVKATDKAEQAGVIAPTTAVSIKKGTTAVSRTMEEFTPEQEYYIGRSVAAVILTKYPSYANKPANEYLNLLGQTLGQASDMPQLFHGYRFLVLNSDEINAFATPGGHIFVTRGLLRCCPNEDAVAAILAHEIGHIQLRHGIQAIKKARITDAINTIATESVRVLAPDEVDKFTETFGGVVSDITNMIQNGYSRAFEYAADDAAQTILRRVGYDPNGLVAMLTVMQKNLKPGDDAGFAKTHPAPQDRINEVLRRTGGAYAPVKVPKARRDRFQKAIGKI